MENIIDEFYENTFNKFNFKKVKNPDKFNSVGECWKIPPEMGEGYYWIYVQRNLFDIKIHDFYLNEDRLMTFDWTECLSITEYESISGEELSPYRRLSAGCIKTFVGGYEPYKILIHKKIPIRSIGIEILPEYYEKYLREQYGADYTNPISAFSQIDQTMYFPEVSRRLKEIKNYRGEGIAARLFYESKVAEIVSLLFEKQNSNKNLKEKKLSQQDIKALDDVTAYLNDHYAFEIPTERLAQIACMGKTKLKSSFKQYHGCTITEYIQRRRMGQAEHLLAKTDLNIGQIAQTVGYSTSSRFAELFKKNTGILPGEYRKFLNNK